MIVIASEYGVGCPQKQLRNKSLHSHVHESVITDGREHDESTGQSHPHVCGLNVIVTLNVMGHRVVSQMQAHVVMLRPRETGSHGVRSVGHVADAVEMRAMKMIMAVDILEFILYEVEVGWCWLVGR